MRSRNDGRPGKQTGRRVLTPTERDGIRREMEMIRADRAGDVEGIPRRMQGHIWRDVEKDEKLMDGREKRLARILADGTPEPISAEERGRLESRERELRESLSKRMITRKMTQLRPGSMEFTKARNAMAKNEMSPGFAGDAAEWKNLRRRLDPDDPDAANLEAIRPE